MGKVYDRIDEKLVTFIESQKMFFVATAPLADNGLINLSPKGLDSFKIIDETTVAYADLTGSGIETLAHLRENGRIVIMFCAFEGAPNIVRLHGTGEAIEKNHPEYNSLKDLFPAYATLRSIIKVSCDRISDSCGFGVPKYEFKEERTQLTDWGKVNGPEKIKAYQRDKNSKSLDGLPGLSSVDNENT